MRIFHAIVFVSVTAACYSYVREGATEDKRHMHRKSPSELRKALFENYDKNVRPVKEFTDVVKTQVGLGPLFIREVDEIKEILVMDAWIPMTWNDNYLTWNPADNDGIKYLNIPSSEVWKPDITTYTASPDKRLLPQVLTNVIVNSTGGVVWVPPLTISTRCPLNLSNYPYDTQQCLIKLGSLTFGKSMVDLQRYSPVVSLDEFVDNNPHWNMIGATAQKVDNYYPCCPNESFPSINFNVTLRRKLSAPVQIAQKGCYFAAFLALLMFWIPPDSIYKVLLGAIADVFLGLMVLYVGTVVPAPVARLKAASWAYVPDERVDGSSSKKMSPSDLRKLLFAKYDKKVRPVKEYTDVITTQVGLAPLFIREVDEKEEILVLDAWITLMWNDDYLTWNPEANDGIKYLNLPSSELWKPDITTYTASPDKGMLPQVLTDVIVYSSGDVIWVPPLTISTRCPLDLSDYPYDMQLCVIKLGSWTYGKSQMDVQPYSDHGIDLSNFADNNPNWALVGAVAERFDNYYPCCPNESYPSINVNVTLRRKRSTPVEIARTVSYYAGFLALIMFWLPADSVYKILLGAFAEILLGLSVLYVGTVVSAPVARLKAAGRIFPVMCAVSGAILIEVLVMNLARVMGPCRPPRCLLAVAEGCCTMFCVCISRPYPGGDLIADTGYTDKMKKRSAQEEWNLVAMALDRALFIIAVVISVFYYKLG